MNDDAQGVVVVRSARVLASSVRLANTFFSRFMGLMGTAALPAGHGLLIVPCNSVHCFGMRYAIDVVYLAADGTVLRVAPNLKPYRIGPIVKGAWAVLELPAGAAGDLAMGDRLVGLPTG